MSYTEIEHTGGDETGPEGSVVIDVLGDHPKTRILLALLTDPDRDYNMTDIARLADTDRSTVYRHIDDLLDTGLVTQTRKAGNAPMYQINHDSDAARAFGRFEWEVIKALGEREPAQVR
jgi:DNA-binding transcriptional ArsR family regulator